MSLQQQHKLVFKTQGALMLLLLGKILAPFEGRSFLGNGQPAASPAKDAGFAAGYTL